MVVGSFTSISLDPPLVGFFPAKTSASWQSMANNERFCVNVLGSSQVDHCQRFSSRSGNKFEGVACGSSPSGQPILDGVIAWIDCQVERVEDIGDHWLVVGRVEALEQINSAMPLLFFKGQYHDLKAISPDQDN